MHNKFEGCGLSRFELKDSPQKFKTYIVPWWKRSESKELKNEIDRRTNGLTCKEIEYLEKTKEHMNIFIDRDRTVHIDKW